MKGHLADAGLRLWLRAPKQSREERMSRTSIIRCVLAIGAIFNFGAALMLIFPDSLGKLIGLPPPGSLFYTWMLALFVGIFGGVYLWLAQRPKIDRPLIVVASVGKVGVFAVALACWQLGQIPGRGVLPAIGDLIFGVVFLWWLVGEVREQ